MCGGIGIWELLVIFAIIMLLLGASRLPELGKALGETVRNFKKSSEQPESLQDPGSKNSLEVHHNNKQIEAEAEQVEEEVKKS